MAQYEAFVGNPDARGNVGMTFKPPIELTQPMVDEALGSSVNRVTLGDEQISAPGTSRYSFNVAGTGEGPANVFGLPVRLRELGARICWLAEARDEGPEATQLLLQGYSQAPIVDLIVER
jgi:hypothetical protein